MNINDNDDTQSQKYGKDGMKIQKLQNCLQSWYKAE